MQICYRCAVQRKIPGSVRLIQMMLYAAVLINTILGSMFGFFFLIPSLGALFLAWYMMGEARVSYEYRLDDTIFTVMRTSGMRSRQKEVEFVKVDLKEIIAAAEQGMHELDEAEKLYRQEPKKRVAYDVSAHDPDCPGALMYVHGVGEERGKLVRICFQTNGELTALLNQIKPGKVNLADA